MIDFHAHLDDEKFDNDREEVLNRAIKVGIKYIINPSTNFISFEKILEIKSKNNIILPMLGVHPHDIKDVEIDEEFENKFKFYLENYKEEILGIGEIGLDYFYDAGYKEKQKKFFEFQLDLAEKYKLPVILHIRNSFSDVFEIVKKYNILPIWHSFAGNYEEAKKFLDLGGFISFSGIITFKNATNIREVLKKLPIDRIFIETDSPYLSPQPFRGKRNEPSYIVYVYETIANLKGIEKEDLENKIYENLKTIFNFIA